MVGVTVPVQIPEKLEGFETGTFVASKLVKFRCVSTRVATGSPEKSGLLKYWPNKSRRTLSGLPLCGARIGNAGCNEINGGAGRLGLDAVDFADEICPKLARGTASTTWRFSFCICSDDRILPNGAFIQREKIPSCSPRRTMPSRATSIATSLLLGCVDRDRGIELRAIQKAK